MKQAGLLSMLIRGRSNVSCRGALPHVLLHGFALCGMAWEAEQQESEGCQQYLE
jgi:hypothetical protein